MSKRVNIFLIISMIVIGVLTPLGVEASDGVQAVHSSKTTSVESDVGIVFDNDYKSSNSQRPLLPKTGEYDELFYRLLGFSLFGISCILMREKFNIIYNKRKEK